MDKKQILNMINSKDKLSIYDVGEITIIIEHQYKLDNIKKEDLDEFKQLILDKFDRNIV